MDPRVATLISSLKLTPHPEGGYFSEVYRSRSMVQPDDARARRTALTTIYFLLAAGDVSRWHRVGSDEVWHYYEGDPLELLTADRNFDQVSSHLLGRLDEGMRFVHAVPAGAWQAARSTGTYTLVGCTVGPGFDFADFEMLSQRPVEIETVRRHHASVARFI